MDVFLGGLEDAEPVEDSVCDRLIFFAGRSEVSSLAGVGKEGGERWARELLGTWMPSDSRDNDLRRVL